MAQMRLKWKAMLQYRQAVSHLSRIQRQSDATSAQGVPASVYCSTFLNFSVDPFQLHGALTFN